MNSIHTTNKQQGAVLFVSLIVLILLTILALAVAKSALFQERVSGNTRNLDIAFQAAETGLRLGEKHVADKKFNVNNNGDYSVTGANLDAELKEFNKPDDFDAQGAHLYEGEGDAADAPSKPIKYAVIEYPPVIKPDGDATAGRPKESYSPYKVYARGYGADQRTVVVLSSAYRIVE